MKLFKLFALSLVALPSVALGMESAQPSFDEAAFEALLKNKGDKNVILCDAQVKYLHSMQSSIKEYKPSTKYTGPCFVLNDDTSITTAFCEQKGPKCLVVRRDGEEVSLCFCHSKKSSSRWVSALKFSGVGLLAAAAITGAVYKRQILHFVSDSEYAREQMHKFAQHYPNLGSLIYWAKDISSPVWHKLAGLFSR